MSQFSPNLVIPIQSEAMGRNLALKKKGFARFLVA